ncbi:MAG: hypothetical protein GX030_08875 [Firmicutes bacterium]|nr:hypothetical protein [Bacillota bacterium]
MANLTQVEFNTIRELLGPAFTGKNKFTTYAEQAQDPKMQRAFQQLADTCTQKANTLLNLLG